MDCPDTFNAFIDGFHEAGNQLHEWIHAKACEAAAADARLQNKLQTPAAFEALRTNKRNRFLAAIGGLPDHGNTPLKTTETGCLQRRQYTIRKILYQSLPGLYGAANLYVPTGLTTPAPAVLMLCGHAREGKAAPAYQRVCSELARSGFVVLIIDSPGHGELLQCLEPGRDAPLVGWNTAEHSFLQLGASLLGENVLRYFLGNAQRALDLLCSLPEVDAERLAVTGNSGGGHLTQALIAIEPRICCAMPCCSLTTRIRYLETGSRVYDGEQNIFGCIPAGLDYDAFLSGFAPRPLRIGAAAHDYFAIEGVLEAVAAARRIYALFGAEDNLDLCLATDEPHGYSTPLRQGCVAWFSRHLLGVESSCPATDPPVEDPADLQCTASGQVLCEFPDARSILDFNRDAWHERRREIRHESPPSREQLRQSLQLPPLIAAPEHVRRTHSRQTADGTSEHLFFFSEPGVIVTAVLYLPPAQALGATLLLIPDGTEGQLPYLPEITALRHSDHLVLVLDVRGTGAVRMRRRTLAPGLACRGTECRAGNDHFLLGTSLAARRCYDILRALAYLRTRPELGASSDIHLVAHGWPAIYGLLAAATDGSVHHCTFTGLPQSWEEAFACRQHNREHLSEGLIAPELRGRFDLPDLLALCRRR